jgi:hypothetical protein
VQAAVPSGGKPSITPSRKEARVALLKEKRRLQRAGGGVNGDEASRKLATKGDPTDEIPGSGGAVRGKKITKAPSMVEEAQARLTGALPLMSELIAGLSADFFVVGIAVHRFPLPMAQ